MGWKFILSSAKTMVEVFLLKKSDYATDIQFILHVAMCKQPNCTLKIVISMFMNVRLYNLLKLKYLHFEKWKYWTLKAWSKQQDPNLCHAGCRSSFPFFRIFLSFCFLLLLTTASHHSLYQVGIKYLSNLKYYRD